MTTLRGKKRFGTDRDEQREKRKLRAEDTIEEKTDGKERHRRAQKQGQGKTGLSLRSWRCRYSIKKTRMAGFIGPALFPLTPSERAREAEECNGESEGKGLS